MITSEDIRAIGKFQRTHALKGELNAVFDEEIDPGAISGELPLILDMDGIYVPFFADSIRPKGQFSSLLKLHGVDSQEEARKFVNKEIFVRKEDFTDLLSEEFIMEEGAFAEDFTGYTVWDGDNLIGKITDIDVQTENALFIVETSQGNKVFIPIVDEFILEVDTEEQALRMSLPEGLVDLN